MLDPQDRRILSLLQRDARRTQSELAEAVGLSLSACAKRTARLWAEGVIEGAVAVLDRARFRRPVTAAVMVTLTAPRAGVSEAFAAAILRHEEVLQCHVVTGDFDFLLMVQARSIEDYHAFAQATFGALPTVRAYKTTFVLRTHKNVDRLPDWALAAPAD